MIYKFPDIIYALIKLYKYIIVAFPLVSVICLLLSLIVNNIYGYAFLYEL